jgi:hypothetical protein
MPLTSMLVVAALFGPKVRWVRVFLASGRLETTRLVTKLR